MAIRFCSLPPDRSRALRPAGAVVLALCAALAATPSRAQDHQVFPLGQGLRDSECVNPGPNNTLNSTPAGDDAAFGQSVLSGANGICETPLGGDDVRPPTGIALGKGAPNAGVVLAGTPASNNGICNDTIVPLGDDAVHVPAGQSEPRQVAVQSGTNNVVNSTLGGDDASTAAICPGNDGILQSAGTVSPADFVVVNNQICITVCGQSTACIIPGTDDVLQSSADPQDVTNTYVSSGANGVGQTTAAGDDVQRIAVGFGFTDLDTVCVTAGPDGIAQTTICGNGIDDFEENGSPPSTGECDDGGTTANDGCSATCTVESGWTCSGQPSACATICGDGLVRGTEPCDDGNASNQDDCLTNCQPPSCGDGFIHNQGTGPFEQCDGGACCTPTCTSAADGTSCNDGSICTLIDSCLNGVCQGTTTCGDGILQVSCGEECDDGGVSGGDGCNATCQDEFCGDGIVNNAGTEECDDGNNRNNDACVQGCKDARCGDGFKQASVEECDDGCLIGVPNTCEPVDDGDGCTSGCVEEPPVRCGDEIVDPGEECDDGNNSNRDDCLNTCKLALCGDGRVHDAGSGTEECDDGNIAPGDGCSPTCAVECGNGVLNGACSEGSVGAACSANADCDTSPGNGVCIGEQCDPGKTCIGGANAGAACAAASACPGGTCAPQFCIPGPQFCSAVCLAPSCGNGAVECSEQCDLGVANGVSGSGCTATCTRNLVGKNELTGVKECPGAWTLDSAPGDLRFRKQTCTDGAPCDFDGAVNGRCTFHVGVCLNRPAPAGCVAGGIQAFDLLRLRFRGICTAGRIGARCVKSPLVDDCETSAGANDGVCLSREADAAANVTDAVRLLAPSIATVPDRCRAGLKGKVCSIDDDNECDRVFGAGDGRCDIGAGVEFDPSLDAGDQVTACTPGVDVVVDAHGKLKLSSHIRRTTGVPDKDKLLLVCDPAP
jgi:cysteine-rich repeat protein